MEPSIYGIIVWLAFIGGMVYEKFSSGIPFIVGVMIGASLPIFGMLISFYIEGRRSKCRQN